MNQSKEGTTYAYKVVLIGDIGVGKTFIVHRFVKGTVPKNPNPTIGVEFSTRTETLANGTKVKAQIWDTAGQERYRSITSAHFRKAVGALLVYDITKEKTFLSVDRWAEELRCHAPDIKILLVGNKLDEVKKDETKRAVRTVDARNYAEKHGMMFQEVSAVDGDNIREAFIELLEDIHNKIGSNYEQHSGNGVVIKSNNHYSETKQEGGCSC